MMKHPVFSRYKRFIEIGVTKNKIFYVAVHPGRVIISLGTKFDIIHVIVSLKTDTCSLKSKSKSADSQSNKSATLFI